MPWAGKTQGDATQGLDDFQISCWSWDSVNLLPYQFALINTYELSDSVVGYSKHQIRERERQMETNVSCLLCSRNYAIIPCFILSHTISITT